MYAITPSLNSREILYTPRGKHFAADALSGSSITPTPRYVLENVALGQNWPEGDIAFHRRITVPTLLLHGMKDDRVTLVEMCEMERVSVMHIEYIQTLSCLIKLI